MKENRITLETAILAKEKRFDVLCEEAYFETEEHTLEMGRGGDCLFPHQLPRILGRCSEDEYTHFIAEAPTQGLLQKWLREVHNIYVDASHDLSADGKYINYYTSWGFMRQLDNEGNLNANRWYDEYSDWRTYEEALEFGLAEALKMITV
jgi:hypothetical protein